MKAPPSIIIPREPIGGVTDDAGASELAGIATRQQAARTAVRDAVTRFMGHKADGRRGPMAGRYRAAAEQGHGRGDERGWGEQGPTVTIASRKVGVRNFTSSSPTITVKPRKRKR